MTWPLQRGLLPLLLLPLLRGVCPGAAATAAAAGSSCRYDSPFASTTTDPAYAQHSIANLSDWRSGVLKRAHQLFHARVAPEVLVKHPEVTATVVRDREGVKSWATGWPIYHPVFAHATCPPPMRVVYFGKPRENPAVYEDGGKWACGPFPEHGCVVYSLGSALDYTFEMALMNDTKCQVFTFDCTVDGTSIHPGRHHFEKLCIGDQGPMVDPRYDRDRLARLAFSPLQTVMKRLGHSQVTYLKIDIEGSEFDVMEHWSESDLHLPLQIGIELHQLGHKHRYTDVDVFMQHMSGLGYAIVLKEDNKHSDICAELVLLKVEQRHCDNGAAASGALGSGGGGDRGGPGGRPHAFGGGMHAEKGHHLLRGGASSDTVPGAAATVDDLMAVLMREQVDFDRLAEGLKARKVGLDALQAMNLRDASELMGSLLGSPVSLRQVSRLQLVAASLTAAAAQHGGGGGAHAALHA